MVACWNLVKLARPDITAVAIDFSEEMLTRLRARFSGDPSVTILAHDLNDPLPAMLGSVRRRGLELRDSSLAARAKAGRFTKRCIAGSRRQACSAISSTSPRRRPRSIRSFATGLSVNREEEDRRTSCWETSRCSLPELAGGRL